MVKSYLLSFDCSLPQGSLALIERDSFKLWLESHWEHQAQLSPHSSQLLIEITKALKKLNISLKELSALTVGVGPGRFTGIRTAICVAKALSYSLKIPIYPVNSLKALAESFLAKDLYQSARIQKKPKAICVALYAFKKQVYWANDRDQFQKVELLDFEDWEKQIQKLPPQSLCLSDIASFYELKLEWRKKIRFIKPQVSAYYLAKQALSPKASSKNWKNLRALYLRDSF